MLILLQMLAVFEEIFARKCSFVKEPLPAKFSSKLHPLISFVSQNSAQGAELNIPARTRCTAHVQAPAEFPFWG